MCRTQSGGYRDETTRRAAPGLVCVFLVFSLGLPLLVFMFSAFMKAKQQRSLINVLTNAPVTYINYHLDFGPRVDSMEVEHVWITVPQMHDNANAVFASNTFWFEKGHGGYMGTQVWRLGVTDQDLGFLFAGDATYRVIFSIWDGSPTHRAEAGTDAISLKNCERFGGEGTGAHCFIAYPIKPGVKVGVRMVRGGRTVQNGVNGDLWVGKAFNPDTSQEHTIGSIFAPDLEGTEGFGLLEPWNSRTAFQEYYEATGCENQALSQVGIFGPWFDKRKILPIAAEAKYTNDCIREDVSRCVEGFGCGKPMALLSAGGNRLHRTAVPGLDLWEEKAEGGVADHVDA